MLRCVPACTSFLLACLLAFTIQIFFYSPITYPDILELPPASAFPANKLLQEVIKLGEGILEGPEDVVVNKDGVVYTAVRDGWIKRMHTNGSWENWKKIDSNALLGIVIAKDGGLIVCDGDLGLLKLSEDGVRVLASRFNGSKIRFADEVIEASDGSLYFSIPSTKFELHNWFFYFLEAKPHGQLLKYDPSLNETSVFLDGLCFPNGVALSREEDYLVFCETWRFRCLKHWLKGNKKGQTEVFIENLPGGPDNINLAPDGSFWIGVLQLWTDGIKFVHTSKPLKYLVASFPEKVLKLVVMNGIHKKATVVNVASDGKITKKFDDPDGKVVSFVTSAFEFEDYLYLGSLKNNFVGKFPLKKSYSA